MEHPPNTIYKATYSGVPVYEFPCRDVAVMRRMSDGWVNATHILKVAGFDKPQRTRILEREVQRETHEKVQGGYGKYQGTWVPLQRAKDVATQYEVGELLAPIFDYEPSENSPPPAPKHAPKARSTRTASNMDGSPAVPAAKKARKANTTNNSNNNNNNNNNTTIKGEKRGRGRPPNNPTPVQPVVRPTVPNFEDDGMLSEDSASVSSRSSSPSEFMSDNELDEFNGYGGNNRNEVEEYNSVAMSMQNRQFLDADMIAAEYSNKLLDYFMAPDDERVPDFLIHPPAGFRINQVIDDEGHTAFHWACSMGILKIIEVLLSIGADITAKNLVGQTPLMRSVMFTNCFDRRTFPRIVELLRETIFYADPQRRTILHHIASTTSSRSKLSSTRYYTEIILAKLSETQPMHELSAFLDRQDVNGDTALHIAARHQARKLCKVLLSYHASSIIQNSSGSTAQEFLVQDANMKRYLEGDPVHQAQLKSSSSPIRDLDQDDSNSGNVEPLQAANNNNTTTTNANTNTSTDTNTKNQNDGKNINNNSDNTKKSEKQNNGKSSTTSTNNNNNNNNNTLVNGHNRMSLPHVADTAIKATQQVAPSIFDRIEQLASIYDAQLREKDSDMERVQQLLTEMNAEISSTDESIRQQEIQIGQEDLVRQQIEDGSEIVQEKLSRLRKLVERTQARDLAQLVHQEESKIDESMMNGGDSGHNEEEVVELMNKLQTLQQERRQYVDEITDLHAKAGTGDKMNDYRRLLASSCGIEIERIDGMLDSIAQALTEKRKDDIEEQEATKQEVGSGNKADRTVNKASTNTSENTPKIKQEEQEQVNGNGNSVLDKENNVSGSNNAISV